MYKLRKQTMKKKILSKVYHHILRDLENLEMKTYH